MKIGVFFPNENEMHLDTLKSFARGLSSYGEDVRPLSIHEYRPEYDVAVIFGVGKKNVPISYPRQKVLDGQKSIGKQTIVLERGYIKRDEYFAVGLNGLNGRAKFSHFNHRPDRFHKLKVDLFPWRDDGEHIVLVGQVPSDASVQNVDIIDWCAYQANLLQQHTNRKIIFRPHPLAVNQTPMIFGTSYSTKPLLEDLENAWAVCTFNSNVGVDAILNGVPVFASDEGSMVWDIANKDIGYLGYPDLPDRDQWAANIAYCQWNHKEMMSGEAWQHIRQVVEMEQTSKEAV